VKREVRCSSREEGFSRREEGFTLIELIVTMAITTVIFGATLTALGAFTNGSKADTLRAEMQDHARTALDRMARSLRNVTAPQTKSPGALDQAGPYAITFDTIDTLKTAGGSNATNAMRVRYCLSDKNPSNEILYRQEKHWTTAEPPAVPTATECPDASAADWDNTLTVATNVTNRIGGLTTRPVFTYAATTTPQIVTVEASLFIDLNPNVQPAESQLTTAVSLRNANRPPVVSFTATQINGYVLLNGSESRDPEGLALSYKWTDNAAVLPSTSEQYETVKLTKGSTHTFTLEVSDPAGLSSSTSQVVTIA
jgi:prepilin-type N-terminal cleavage/methylation domain-containing protein